MVAPAIVSAIVPVTLLSGAVFFNDEGSQTISFPSAVAAATYRVQVHGPAAVMFWVDSKTTADFVINASISHTGQVGFDVFE